MSPTNDQDELERVGRLLREASGRMAEAYALLRRCGPRSEGLRWDDAFAWQLEELQKAVDTCAALERRLDAAGGDR